MIGLVNIVVLVVLLRFLSDTHRHILCATLYTACKSIIYLIFLLIGDDVDSTIIVDILISIAVTFGLSLLYFWLLTKLKGILWWCVAALGIIFGFV